MSDLNENRRFTLDSKTFAALKENYRCGSVDSERCLKTLREVFEQHHYMLDPHSAVAWRVAQENKGDNPMLVASTANWAKFGSNVYRALFGIESGDALPSELDGLTDVQINRKVYEHTQVSEIPAALDVLDDKPVRFTEIIDGDAEAIENSIIAFSNCNS